MPERLGNGETGLICIGSYSLASTGDSIDDWTHFLHGPDGNTVAGDIVVGPPEHLQWIEKPIWSRHHDVVFDETTICGFEAYNSTRRWGFFFPEKEGYTVSVPALGLSVPRLPRCDRIF